MKSTIECLQDAVGTWSDETFGDDRPPNAIIAHLKKEAEELYQKPFALEEYADCLLLLLDAARVAGFSANVLAQAAFMKLRTNVLREWGEPDENGAVEHVRKAKGCEMRTCGECEHITNGPGRLYCELDAHRAEEVNSGRVFNDTPACTDFTPEATYEKEV